MPENSKYTCKLFIIRPMDDPDTNLLWVAKLYNVEILESIVFRFSPTKHTFFSYKYKDKPHYLTNYNRSMLRNMGTATVEVDLNTWKMLKSTDLGMRTLGIHILQSEKGVPKLIPIHV